MAPHTQIRLPQVKTHNQKTVIFFSLYFSFIFLQEIMPTRSGRVFTPYMGIPRVIPQPIHKPVKGIPIVQVVQVPNKQNKTKKIK
jgi:hypothetical protein